MFFETKEWKNWEDKKVKEYKIPDYLVYTARETETHIEVRRTDCCPMIKLSNFGSWDDVDFYMNAVKESIISEVRLQK